ncbi:MAG: septum formation initiator family protein [Candidatus Eisenbacteria bacterium]|nr:septum formation initiator family protein [Candidatus Eisenbacteria bacterium]
MYTFLFGDTGYLRERAMKRELAALDQEIELLRKQGEELRTVAGGLREGGIEIERIGRERLGMVRPGEVSYRLVPMDKDGWSLDRRATGR